MQSFRSRFGQVITYVVAAVMLLALFAGFQQSGFWGVAASIAPATLFVFLVWATFHQPRVEVSQERVRIVNVFRTFDIPMRSISRIDTRWALTLYVGKKKYTSWGATAPGRHTSFFATKDQGSHLPETTYLAGTVRPGDLVNTDSGAAAAYIRRLWEDTRETQGETEPVSVKWHSGTLMALSVLTGMTIASL